MRDTVWNKNVEISNKWIKNTKMKVPHSCKLTSLKQEMPLLYLNSLISVSRTTFIKKSCKN